MRDFQRILILLPLFLSTTAFAEREGVHCSVITDQDGDEAILMESEWISMHLLPRMQAIINRFVFRPTGNDIVEALHAKIRMMGGGILMDCFWEQDWRFQELKEKPYTFKVTKIGPDEGQVVFDTDIEGWVGSDGSGVISKLLSNMTLRRTVTLKAGQPFFRFDFEFINNDRYAKRPTFWPHNSSIVDVEGIEAVTRPSARGHLTIQGLWGRGLGGDHYIVDFNHGWSARIAPDRREGIIYLMDYDYIMMLYNNGNGTCEWMYDSILSFKKQPWKGRIYILPIIGLSSVDYANEYFVCQFTPRREEGRLIMDFHVTSSYEKVAQVSFNTRVETHLLKGKPRNEKGETVTIDGIGIEPAKGRAEIDLDAPDPIAFEISAFAELPDGSIKKFNFEKYYPGEYDSGMGFNRRRDGKIVKEFPRPVRKPKIPKLPPGLTINREEFNVFGIFGLGTYRSSLKKSIEAIPDSRLEIGYCTGADAYGYGLGDFPYDYERLFNFRALVFSNIKDKEFRGIGASILMPWLKAGGGLVLFGGEYAFTFELREHEINQYYPVQPQEWNMRKGALQLQPPEVKDHPIFRGIDLSDLPYLYYSHDIKLKENTDARTLMKIGTFPFIIEKRNGYQITMTVASNHFGIPSDFEGKPHLRHWKEWPKLVANIVRYAGGDLK